jgi:hypothetical protein
VAVVMNGRRSVDVTTGEVLPPKASDAVTFMQLAYASAGVKPEDIHAATRWPSLDREKAAPEWEELRGWVGRLRRSFEFLDHHVIPYCWWRHNGHVEALAALRDHERVSFAPLAPARAPLDWLRALRDTAAPVAQLDRGLALRGGPSAANNAISDVRSGGMVTPRGGRFGRSASGPGRHLPA